MRRGQYIICEPSVLPQNEREIDAALKRSEALRQAILKKAFTGRLVPRDPADDPPPNSSPASLLNESHQAQMSATRDSASQGSGLHTEVSEVIPLG